MQNISLTIKRIKELRNGILKTRLQLPLFQKSLKDVKRVVIINSSSRSGSSLLYTLLSRLPQVYSLSGEAAPFYKLNTAVAGCNLFESDKIPTSLLDSAVDQQGLARDFFTDLHRSDAGILTHEIDVEAYADDLMLRFALQWTDLDIEPLRLKACILAAFERYAAKKALFRTEDFYLDLLEAIMALHPQVNPFYYDISTEKVALRFPFLDVPVGPPNAWFNIEEPPFILLSPRPKVTPLDLEENTLLLKSTVDCYRMNLIERTFPAAEIRIIHLTRNPAATTNGIYDGWLHRGFFSHNLRPYFETCGELRELSIKGYSEVFPYGRFWWNFDLPEGWQGVADRDLVEVCAFQWYSANTEIVKYLARTKYASLQVRFEDVLRGLESRTRSFEAMLGFMGMPLEQAALLDLDDLPVVQSTLPPQLYRWKKRKDILARLLEDPRIVDRAAQLGYFKENTEEWL